MAATRIISMHTGKGKSPAVSLTERIDYILNPAKTDGGRWVTSCGCDPATAAAEMLLTRQLYRNAGGRQPPGNKEVLAYHIRQAFKPGEIPPGGRQPDRPGTGRTLHQGPVSICGGNPC